MGDRAIIGSGNSVGASNIIEYITISIAGNTSDFGDATVARYGTGAASNGPNDRGIIAGGYVAAPVNIIDYITISTVGDATDFGDLTEARYGLSGVSNGINDRVVVGFPSLIFLPMFSDKILRCLI